MELSIKDDTPIKYQLNMHLMKDFISMDAIGFEITKYIINDINSNEKKELALDNFKFTTKTLKYIFGDRMKDSEFKEYIISKLKHMISINWITPVNKSLCINSEMISHFYNIN